MRTSHTALLVIDVQRGIIDDPRAWRAAEVLAAIGGLAAQARAAGVPVVYVRHDGAAGSPVEAGTPGAEIHSAVEPLPGETVIHKRACDSFLGSRLDDELRSRGIGRIVVTGCMSQYCVDTACRRALSLGYDVILASDAHTTWDMGGLTAGQIACHHNAIFQDFSALDHAIRVQPAAEIRF
jgi:nicotinamidase-related amidase